MNTRKNKDNLLLVAFWIAIGTALLIVIYEASSQLMNPHQGSAIGLKPYTHGNTKNR
jgi:hypothetical protein